MTENPLNSIKFKIGPNGVEFEAMHGAITEAERIISENKIK